MKAAPKRLSRIHRRGRAAFVGREPLPAVEAWVTVQSTGPISATDRRPEPAATARS
jgi:hypothetical protein